MLIVWGSKGLSTSRRLLCHRILTYLIYLVSILTKIMGRRRVHLMICSELEVLLSKKKKPRLLMSRPQWTY